MSSATIQFFAYGQWTNYADYVTVRAAIIDADRLRRNLDPASTIKIRVIDNSTHEPIVPNKRY